MRFKSNILRGALLCFVLSSSFAFAGPKPKERRITDLHKLTDQQAQKLRDIQKARNYLFHRKETHDQRFFTEWFSTKKMPIFMPQKIASDIYQFELYMKAREMKDLETQNPTDELKSQLRYIRFHVTALEHQATKLTGAWNQRKAQGNHPYDFGLRVEFKDEYNIFRFTSLLEVSLTSLKRSVGLISKNGYKNTDLNELNIALKMVEASYAILSGNPGSDAWTEEKVRLLTCGTIYKDIAIPHLVGVLNYAKIEIADLKSKLGQLKK